MQKNKLYFLFFPLPSPPPQGKNYIIPKIKSFLLFSTWNLDTFKNRRISETLTSVAMHFAASLHDIWFCMYIQIAGVVCDLYGAWVVCAYCVQGCLGLR